MLLLNTGWKGVLVFELQINRQSVLLKYKSHAVAVARSASWKSHSNIETAHYPSTAAHPFSSLAEEALKGKEKG